MEKIRIDKWLWAARFYKTRSLAVDEIDKGRVLINQLETKASREVKAGDVVAMRQGHYARTVKVLGVSDKRGAAPVAQLLYEETPESLQARALAAEQRRFGTEPAQSLTHGRPTKRDRRDLQKDWNNRWSASVDE